MIFPGFPGVLSFFQVFQVFQVEWEPCVLSNTLQKFAVTKTLKILVLGRDSNFVCRQLEKKSNLLLKHCHSISLLRVGSLKLILSKNIYHRIQIEVNLIQALFLSKKESRYGCDTLTKCTCNMQSTSRACACVLPVLIRIAITLYGLRVHLCRAKSKKIKGKTTNIN